MSDKKRLNWDIFIIILALYNSITIPLSIAFDPPFLNSLTITAIESLIDLIFFLDILVNLRTTYISSKTGDEIYNPKEIARKYLLSVRFFIDLLSSIPFDKIAP